MEDVTRLVTIEAAEAHLRETSNVAATRAEVERKLDQATAFIVRKCGTLADAAWDETTVPAPVHTAILLHLTELFTDRGDDGARVKPFGSDAVAYLTAAGYRDPVLA